MIQRLAIQREVHPRETFDQLAVNVTL
jgi:hypothetical protein